MSKRVIITYGWCRVAYAALRCLAENGLEVIVGGPNTTLMAGCSRFTYATFSYPSPYTDPVGFVDAVADAARRYDADVFLPMHEEILAVAAHRERLPSRLKVPIADSRQLLTAYDKGLTMALAREVGVPIPETVHPDSVDEVSILAGGLNYPAWIKIRKSNSAKGVFKVFSAEDLIDQYPVIVKEHRLDANSLPIIQQHIPGTVYAVSMLYDHGHMVSRFVRKNLREKTYGGGTCTKCESVSEPLLEGYAEKLLNRLRWHGPAMMEFKYDSETGRGYLLEINPRYHGTLDHDIQSGVPTPYLQYCVAVQDGMPDSLHNYQLGVKSRWLLGDMIGLLDHLLKAKTMRERVLFIKSLLTFDDDHYMDLKKDDIRPFLIQGWFYLSKFLRTGSRNPIDQGMVR